MASVVVEATDHYVWYLNFSGRDITEALDVVAGKKSKAFKIHFTKTLDANAARPVFARKTASKRLYYCYTSQAAINDK